MRSLSLFISLFIGLFFLSQSCNQGKKAAGFDFNIATFKKLAEGDSLSQAYLEAYTKFQRGDSLANTPFSLSEIDTFYNGADQYKYPIIPLKYVLSKDSNTDFLREEDITYNRVPQLSTASLQVYEANQWAKNIRIYTHLFSSRDKHPLLIIELPNIFSSEYRIFAPQKNGFWKLVKIILLDDEEDCVFFHQAMLVSSDNNEGTILYAWHEQDFVFARLPFPYLYSPSQGYSGKIAKNAYLHNCSVFGAPQYAGVNTDTIKMSYVWDLQAKVLLTKGDTSFQLAQKTIVLKEIVDIARDSFVRFKHFERLFFEPNENYWRANPRQSNTAHTEWDLFARIDSLQSIWVWDSQQKAYTCTQIGAANGLFSQQLKAAWDIDKHLCIHDPEKFKAIAMPAFEKLSGDYKNFVYSDSLVQTGWQLLDVLIHKPQ